MTILLGVPEDPPLASVRDALIAAGAPFLLVDQREIDRFSVELTVAAALEGSIICDGVALRLDEVRSIYLRPYDPSTVALQATPPGSWTVEQALVLLADAGAVIAVNRPGAMASNASKPFQLDLIRRQGFSTPETILSTDPDYVRDFWRRQGRVIYKSMSGVRSIVSQLRDERAAALDDVTWCPTQFQRYIPGVEYRVHVVRDRTFACRILSDADDYRYSSATMHPCELPAEIASRCVKLTAALGLLVAGIDLRRTPEDEWFCLEVNPSPAFSCFEPETGPEIGPAIASLLSGCMPPAPALDLVEMGRNR